MIKFNKKLMIVSYVFALLFFFSLTNNFVVFAEDNENNISILYNESVKNIDYKYDKLYLSDNENKKIIIKNLKDNSIEEISTVSNPNLVFSDYQGTLCHTEDVTFGLFVEETSIKQIGNNDLSHMLDICCDIQNNIYVICEDATNTPLVLIKKYDVNSFEIFCELDDLTLTTDSKITSSFENEFLILYTKNNFYKITENNFSLLSAEDYELPTLSNVLDIKLDFHDNLYILGDNKLFRCNKNGYQTLENSALNTALEFELDYLTGDIILRTSTNVKKLENIDFVITMNSSTPDYKTEIYNCSIIQTTEETYLYEFDNSLYIKSLNNQEIKIPENTKLIKLTQTDNNFYFVLINNLSNENITGYIKSSCVEEIEESVCNTQIRITNNTTPLYLYPTSLDEDLVLKDGNNNIKYLDKIILTMTSEDFGITDNNGVNFAKVLYEGEYYYINTKNFVIAEKITIQPITEELNEDTVIYTDQSFSNSKITLPKGTAINILETGENYAKISYGTEIGYIKYKLAEEIHITVWQLLAIILLTIIAVVGVILSIVAILKHKQQKM